MIYSCYSLSLCISKENAYAVLYTYRKYSSAWRSVRKELFTDVPKLDANMGMNISCVFDIYFSEVTPREPRFSCKQHMGVDHIFTFYMLYILLKMAGAHAHVIPHDRCQVSVAAASQPPHCR